MATMLKPLSHLPAPNKIQTVGLRETQVPPSSLNRETFEGLNQCSQKPLGPAVHNHRIRPLYKHPHQLKLYLRHRQKAASCLA